MIKGFIKLLLWNGGLSVCSRQTTETSNLSVRRLKVDLHLASVSNATSNVFYEVLFSDLA